MKFQNFAIASFRKETINNCYYDMSSYIFPNLKLVSLPLCLRTYSICILIYMYLFYMYFKIYDYFNFNLFADVMINILKGYKGSTTKIFSLRLPQNS